MRTSTAYNFEDQPIQVLKENSAPTDLKVLRRLAFNVAGILDNITHKIGSGGEKTIAKYTYNDLGQQISKTFPEVSSSSQTYGYNIRGWLTGLGSNHHEVYKQDLFYHTGPTPLWNGNITKLDWSGRDGVKRSYSYTYDKPNRLLTATYTVPSATTQNTRYNVSGISYDANGNLLRMQRRGQAGSTSYGLIDDLTYGYGQYSNKLTGVTDVLTSNTFTSKDFKPNTNSTAVYGYDENANLVSNKDKRITSIKYNHLNLPSEVVFESGGKITYGYDALGNKLTQKVYSGSTLTKTQQYIGEMVYLNGSLDYLIHEEGRVALELMGYQYEFNIKDHLGNIRQVIRPTNIQGFMATMETQFAEEEEENFMQLSETRQLASEHNKTIGGNQVAWLNASRGRMLGPSRTQEIFNGDSLRLNVYGKYVEDKKVKANKASFATPAKDKLITGLTEFAELTERSGKGNPFLLFNIADIIAKDLQQRDAPEAYLMYALYDQDSNLYEVGKRVLSKNAANQHEELEENLYIGRDGFVETFVVNETEEDVWFDNFMVQSSSSIVVQETHYDPWGLELTGLGYQYGGIKVNRYLYNGKENQTDHNYDMYDYGARFYDPAIGRWSVVDPMADIYPSYSPYNYTLNNPIIFIDPNGMWVETADSYNFSDPGEIRKFMEAQQRKTRDNDRTFDGGTLPEHTVNAPRWFEGVLGRAADKWMDNGPGHSTYGQINFNYTQARSTSISLIDGNGIYLNGILPIGGIAFELERIKYAGENGRQSSDWYFTVRTGWGLDVGAGGMGTIYNARDGKLRNENIVGPSFHTSFLNYQNTQSIEFTRQEGVVLGRTSSHSISLGFSPAFPVKLSGSVGVGYTFNISKFR